MKFSNIFAETDSSVDVVSVINEIVNVLTTINGMNDVDVDNTDVVNTATGFDNVEVMVGSSGSTTKVNLGDFVNVIGAIQGFWYNYDIANVNVHLGDDDDDDDDDGGLLGGDGNEDANGDGGEDGDEDGQGEEGEEDNASNLMDDGAELVKTPRRKLAKKTL